MPTATAQSRTQRPARTGRPARIDVAAVVDAAIGIGLSRVTLRQVAERVGVTVPALYRHVKSRDELVKLAAIELTLHRRAAGEAKDWTEVVRDCAHGMVQLFTAEPQLIREVMNGTLGPDGEMDFVEEFLAAMARHGFKPEESVRIHHSVAMLAIGAAVSATAMKSGYAGGASHAEAVRAALARRKRDELPLVRGALRAYLDVDPRQWEQSLHALVADIAARRAHKGNAAKPKPRERRKK